MTAPKIGLAIVETPRVIKVCCLLRLLVGAYRVEELGFHILKLSLMEGLAIVETTRAIKVWGKKGSYRSL
ncbi:hypothetical protein ZEAMMB73_Zm00001d019156 [Zea mays]|uniref:Uncharacterized protein n=1 Tax=Zea mays TaxID=4577 RepID=A0A1D6HVV9_MAIZE|nr:hypothetical protein ZEAMMB73_Zm00001d019156 [Zea mays]